MCDTLLKKIISYLDELLARREIAFQQLQKMSEELDVTPEDFQLFLHKNEQIKNHKEILEKMLTKI